MKVFLAGGSGAVGRRLIPQLVAAGHEVTAMTQNPANEGRLRGLGAEPAICDVFDAPRLAETVAAAGPEVVLQQLTRLPQRLRGRGLARQYAANNRVRDEGTRNLIAAARGAGARRLVAQGMAIWYAPRGDGRLHGEDDPLWRDAPEPIGTGVRTMQGVEDAVLRDPALEGVVLRYGLLYGPGTWYAPDGDVAEQVRKRRYPVLGSGDAVYSFLHVDDAAGAAVAALHGPAGVYNVVDDEPAPISTWLPEYAAALGAPPPRRVPGWLAKLGGGRGPVSWLLALEGADNRRAREALGWRPRHASWRTGFRAQNT
ncbi:MAG: NAD(P)-dependent oxidoreductase [Actinomycetota bacterium]|nr:NAD(P)-dependent oxidoreductase [Actinomycetota bacterium]